jgi:hypothetical protein
MKLIPLSSEERIHMGFSHKVIVTFADLTAAATTQTLILFPDASPADVLGTQSAGYTLPSGTYIAKCGFQLITPFSGGSVSALTVGIGDGGSATRYSASNASDLFTTSSNTKNASVGGTGYTFTQSDVAAGNVAAVTALFTATGGNLSTLTAGVVELYIAVHRLNDLTVDTEPG